ncbi:TPA: MSHA biogenesis protein MshQ [Vibrio vulnificus]|nr:MSHA biogenesis protein MshQ [Vibrio vulnificus]HDY7430099.1 MSHA biogenesis protein MshQ [Vibrio vulnificus]HDY7568771.1 MSHA biogenesis protein MshQ [Vibrio vulnificus]HDY8087170.1 MSHA biogenesis protein MshQ [Vibrio vulnificus]HDY8109828.1 MSHA biogenesis protein MshQ [Vibrio vulnificus]
MSKWHLLALSISLPFTSNALEYDLYNAEHFNQLCNQSTSQQGDIFRCNGEFSLPNGAKLIASKAPKNGVTLSAFGGAILHGNNQVGSPDKRISITALSTGISILQPSHGPQPKEYHRSQIFGDLNSQNFIHMTNAEVDGNVATQGLDVMTHGDHNIINGDVFGHHKVVLNNTNVCGDIASLGHQIFITSNKATHYVVGNITSLNKLDLRNIDVYGQIHSQGSSAHLDLSGSAVYAQKTALNLLQSGLVENGVVCGEITAHQSNIRNVENYCGISDLGCNYSNQGANTACPVPESIPLCEIKPPVDHDYEFAMSPENDMALMCGENLPQFNITTSNNGELASVSMFAEVSDPALFDVVIANGIGSGAYPNFVSSSQGQLRLVVRPKNISAIKLDRHYTLSVYPNGEPQKRKTVRFLFTPYMFETYDPNSGQAINELALVAAKPEPLGIRLLACNDKGNPVVASSYHGNPTITHTVTTPSKQQGGRDGERVYQPIFTSGISENTISLSESGLFALNIHDTFDCAGFDQCPPSGKNKVSGRLSLKVRPWTLAICEGDRALESGDALGGSPFLPAGERFSLNLIPIQWVANGSLTQAVNTQALCSTPVTHNFYLSNAPAARVKLSSQQATPVETATAQTRLLESDSGMERAHDDVTNGAYWFDGLRWREVGSLRVQSDLVDPYLGMKVNQGYRYIGRFYPKYFKVHNQQWDYPNSQTFAYMNQPFDQVIVDIDALNSLKEPIANYRYFSTTAHFELAELGDHLERFVTPSLAPTQWREAQGSSIGRIRIVKQDHCANSACWLKDDIGQNYPDGPFNTYSDSAVSKIGLVYLENADPVTFYDDTHILPVQPDVRFGRLNFEDVGGYQGQTIVVPLDVEYWRAGEFVNNKHDHFTLADGAKHYQQPIWSHSLEDNAYLAGIGKMQYGQTRAMKAKQKVPAREQVRFWLDLTSTQNNLPWLQYDWDKTSDGEEDPSTVVTFGIYRGHDKIIFRGEPNLTGVL